MKRTIVIFIVILLVQKTMLFSMEKNDVFWSLMKERFIQENWKFEEDKSYRLFSLFRIGKVEINDIEKDSNCIIQLSISEDGTANIILLCDFDISSYKTFHISLREKNNKFIDDCHFHSSKFSKLYDNVYSILIGPVSDDNMFLKTASESKGILYSILNYEIFNLVINCYGKDGFQDIKISTEINEIPFSDFTIDFLLYYAIIARDVKTVRKILEINPNILIIDKQKLCLPIKCFMNYYEENTKDSIELAKSRKINDLLIEYGIEKSETLTPFDPDAKIYKYIEE